MRSVGCKRYGVYTVSKDKLLFREMLLYGGYPECVVVVGVSFGAENKGRRYLCPVGIRVSKASKGSDFEVLSYCGWLG